MWDIRIELALNNICNFRCSYCCGHLNERMSNIMIAPVNVERLVFYLNTYRYNDIKIFKICGGEPLLYPHLSTLYKILSKSNNTSISMDTNGSICINKDLLNSIKLCNNNHVNIEFVFSYHKEILDKHSEFLTNYYINIQKLLNNNINVRIRLLYDNSTYLSLNNIANDFLCRFNGRIKIEWRLIFDSNNNKEIIGDKKDKCYPYYYFGIFPNNKLYYSCFREIYNGKCKQYDINKKNLVDFMSNMDKEAYMPHCCLHDNLLFCADI